MRAGVRSVLDSLAERRFRRILEHFALMDRTREKPNGLSQRIAPERRRIQGQLLHPPTAGAFAGWFGSADPVVGDLDLGSVVGKVT